jgi:hypothetical protein
MSADPARKNPRTAGEPGEGQAVLPGVSRSATAIQSGLNARPGEVGEGAFTPSDAAEADQVQSRRRFFGGATRKPRSIAASAPFAPVERTDHGEDDERCDQQRKHNCIRRECRLGVHCPSPNRLLGSDGSPYPPRSPPSRRASRPLRLCCCLGRGPNARTSAAIGETSLELTRIARRNVIADAPDCWRRPAAGTASGLRHQR